MTFNEFNKTTSACLVLHKLLNDTLFFTVCCTTCVSTECSPDLLFWEIFCFRRELQKIKCYKNYVELFFFIQNTKQDKGHVSGVQWIPEKHDSNCVTDTALNIG